MRGIGWRVFAVVLGISFVVAPHVADPSDAVRGANLVAAILAWGIADILSALRPAPGMRVAS